VLQRTDVRVGDVAATSATSVPSNTPTDYNPNSIGTRPAYGWYLHNVNNVTFTDSSVDFAPDDGRPAVIANAGADLRFDRTVTAPMQIQADPAASGGHDVTVASGNNSKSSAPSDGSTVIPFTVGAAGTYNNLGRVIAPTDDDDSFWVRVDNGPWTDRNDIPAGSSWHWAAVTDDTDSDAVVLPGLAAGAHSLTFAYREDGARLDRVLITNDLALTPAG
jgi:hypothetical protein